MGKADNLPPSCAVVTKSGNLILLEPSGTLRACNGTSLPFYYKIMYHRVAIVNATFCNMSEIFCTVEVTFIFQQGFGIHGCVVTATASYSMTSGFKSWQADLSFRLKS